MYVPSIFPILKNHLFFKQIPKFFQHTFVSLTYNPWDLRAGRPREEAVGTWIRDVGELNHLVSSFRFEEEKTPPFFLHSFKVGAPHHPMIIKMEWNNRL